MEWKYFAMLNKKAQAPGFIPTPLYYSSMMPSGMSKQVQKDWAPGGALDSSVHRSAISIPEGMARGAKNAIPGIIDYTAGTIAGLEEGVRSWKNGGIFEDGWNRGFDAVRRHGSDPIRKAEMYLGGNALKRMFNSTKEWHESNMENGDLGPRRDAEGNLNSDWEDYLGAISVPGKVMQVGTEIALTWPMYAKMFGQIGRLPRRGQVSATAGVIAAPPAIRAAAGQIDEMRNNSYVDSSKSKIKKEVHGWSPEIRSRKLSNLVSNDGLSFDDKIELANQMGIEPNEFDSAYSDYYLPAAMYFTSPKDSRRAIAEKYGIDVNMAKKYKDRAMQVDEYIKSGGNPDIAQKYGLTDREVMIFVNMMRQARSGRQQ